MTKRFFRVYSRIIVVFILFLCIPILQISAEKLFKDLDDYTQASIEAQNKLKEDLSKGDSSQIEKLIRENPNDAEIHQGIAELLVLLGYDYADTTISEYKKAISIASKEEHLRIGPMIMNISLLTYYDEIKRYNYDVKYDEKDKENIINTLMKECNEAEELWPQNAFYNYVKAYVYFMQNEKEKAEIEIQKALGKPYMRQYRVTILTSRHRVLTLMDFPLREKIAVNQTFTTTYVIPWGTCVKYLNAKGEDFQKNRKFKEAIELYNGSVKIYRQREEDNLNLLGPGEIYDIPLEKRYNKIYECYKELGLQSEAEAVQREIYKIKEKKVEFMQQQQIEEWTKFLTTADAEEIEKEYKQILKQGYIMK